MADPIALVVPMSVEALCINNRTDASTQQFVGASADFSDLPAGLDGTPTGQPYLSGNVPSFASQSLERGVHLHWALPDAFTHGERGDGDRVAFPAVPNRWLVTRVHTSNADPTKPVLQLVSWVIESDYVDGTARVDSVSVPLRDADGNQYFQYLGRSDPYPSWQPGAQDPEAYFGARIGRPLTAVGYGEATFAAYYPNCRGVFGFLDPLDALPGYDPVNDKLTYLVAGWFADPSDDPLASRPPLQLGWGTTAGAPVPSTTVCAGVVQNIPWDPNADYFPSDGSVVDVAVGVDNVSSLSALLAAEVSAKAPDAEFFLNAVQLGLLSQIEDETDRAARLESAMHGGGFASSPGGSIWIIGKGAPSITAGGDPDFAAVASAVTAELPRDLGDALNQLNTLQQSYDRAQRELASLRRQLYLDWYRYMVVVRQDGLLPSGIAVDPGALRAFVDGERQSLAARQTASGVLVHDEDGFHAQGAAGSLAAQLAQNIAAVTTRMAQVDPTLALTQAPAPRFWQPNDPVVLLAGPDVAPPLRYGGDAGFSDDGLLPCRLSSELLDTLAIAGARPATVGAADLLGGESFDRTPCAAVLRSLVVETLLTDPTQARLVAAAGAAKTGLGADALAADFAALQAGLAAGTLTAGALSVAGRAPGAPAITAWRPRPWIPLYLKWSIDFMPQQLLAPSPDDVLTPDLVTAHYALDPAHVDLLPSSDAVGVTQTYDGVTLLSRHATLDLEDQLARYLAANPDPALAALAAQLHFAPMLAQALDGFHQALLMRRSTLQLSVEDPLAEGPLEAQFSLDVGGAVAGANQVAPSPLVPFNPIRAGFAQLSALALIDAFGQLRPIDLSRPIARASALTPSRDVTGTLLYLAPRLSQPARLLFRFLSADDDEVEMNAHPATSPVCGWVLPNYVEDTLAIYARDGSALGALVLAGGGRAIEWRPAPASGQPVRGAADPAAEAALVTSTIADLHLRGFVLGVLQNPQGPAFAAALLRAADRALAGIAPPPAAPRGLGVLIGRPLALTRASLALELAGLPAPDLGWPALARDVAAGPTAPRTARAFPSVELPVRLGELEQLGDGLVGYFRDVNGATDYTRFYSAAAEGDAGVVLPSADPIALTSDPMADPERVTLLLDPHVAVHATTGALPVKSLILPPEQWADALAAMQVTFAVNPILTPSPLTLPLATIPGSTWSWVDVPGAAYAETVAIAGASERATYAPQSITEGWLRLTPRYRGDH